MAKAKKSVKKTVKAKTRRAPARKSASKEPSAPSPTQTVTPYLAVNDAAGAIAWYKTVFGAKVAATVPAPGGKLMHAEIRIGGSPVYMSDIFPGADLVDPTRAGASVNLHVWSRNIDKWWNNATENGAKVTMPLADQFWGDRYGKLLDPWGHSWSLGWKSKLSKAELEKLRVEAMKGFGQ